jgi:PAS domain S-box-containing protein
MSPAAFRLDRVAQRLGGTRVLALPMLRVLAVVAGFTWVLLTPPARWAWTPVSVTMLAFFVYSAAVIGALWRWPGITLRLNFWILLADVTFALLLIRFSGGARSTLFLALLLIAGLQSYYYGIVRGVAVAVAAAAAYLAVVWPTITDVEWANMAIRLVVLVGTAVGVGILAQTEEAERLRVLELTGEVQKRQQFIQSVVESLSEGVVALDREGRIQAWNQAMERRYRIPAAEVMGRSFFDCFPAVLREPLGDELRRLLGGETEAFTLEAMEHETLRRGRVVQNLKGSLLRLDGAPIGAVLLIEDITERVALERSARQAEKLAALGTLAAGLAHELNNPIGIISSRIEIMLLDAEARPLPAEVMEDLRVLHRHAQRVARIAQGLLSFARQSSGRREAVDLNHLVEETLLLIEKQAAKDGIAIKKALAPDVPPVLGDGNALQQVVMNLLTNARDALAGSGEIAIETQAVPGPSPAARLVVRDTGPGIPPEVLPRIFDPFFTTKPDGTGLGLSISYGIVREHRGTVDVQSRPGEGTTFVLTFPPMIEGNAA